MPADPLTADALGAVEQAFAKMTPGPWEHERSPGGTNYIRAKIQEYGNRLLNFFDVPRMHDVSFQLDDKGTLHGRLAYDSFNQFPAPGWNDREKDNAAGIVALVNTFPALLALLRETQKERDEAKTVHEFCQYASSHDPSGVRYGELRRAYDTTAALLEQQTAENARLRTRLLSAAGDDLCRLTQEEIKDLTGGKVQIPPKEEFLASCERFHAQIANDDGVLPNCLTLAQLIAENERHATENARLREALKPFARYAEQWPSTPDDYALESTQAAIFARYPVSTPTMLDCRNAVKALAPSEGTTGGHP